MIDMGLVQYHLTISGYRQLAWSGELGDVVNLEVMLHGRCEMAFCLLGVRGWNG